MIFPFETIAANGEPMPDGLDLPDQYAFQFLANMYARIRNGNLDREQAAKEKGAMTYKHSIAKNILKSSSIMAKYWADLRRDIECIHTAYIKNPTKENADALIAALDGRL